MKRMVTDSSVRLSDLEMSGRLYSALRAAGAYDLSVAEFCRRFPHDVLKKHRNFNRNTLIELARLLRPMSGDPSVAGWLGGLPAEVTKFCQSLK